MPKMVRIALWVLAILLTLLLLIAAALYLFVDAEPYRDILQTRLSKALDREVGFGEMQISFLPTFGLRLDDFEIQGRPGEPEKILLSAKSLRAGARLLPLLRKRLEVTSIVVDRPVFALHRAADGSWQPTSLLAEETAAEPQKTDSSSFSVRNISIRNGSLALRMEGTAGLTLEDLSLKLRDVAPDKPMRFELSADIGEMPAASIRAIGTGRTDGSELSGSIELLDIDPGLLMDLLGAMPELTKLPPKLLGDSTFSASTDLAFRRAENILQLDNVELSGIALNLRRGREGDWEIARFLEELGSSEAEAGDELQFRLGKVVVDSGSIHIDDASAPLTFDLTGMKLVLGPTVRDVATPVELSCSVDTGAGKGRLAVRGTLGPPLDLEFDLEPVAIGGLAVLLPEFGGLDAATAEVGANMTVRGDFANSVDFSGSATLSGLTAVIEDTAGKRSLPVDLKLEGAIGMSGGGDKLELRDVAITPARGGNSGPLSFRGTIDLSGEATVVDIQLLPTRIVADDLAALAALIAPDLPVSFSSPEPLELAVTVRGPLGGEQWPEMTGSAKLAGFTFRHASMLQPMEQVQASVKLEGRRIAVEGLRAVIGASDIAGSLIFAKPDPPTLIVDLASNNADFWELFSFIAPEEPGTRSATEPAEDPLARLIVEGKIAIAGGSLASLRFSNLQGRIDYRNSILNLEQLELDLYAGHFSGRISQDMRETPATLTMHGKIENVSADPFLTDNLDLAGVLSGSASADLDIEVLTGDEETMFGSLAGGGPLLLIEGRLAKIEVMRPLSRVAGVFGEGTAKRLARQLSSEGTPFARLEMQLGFGKGKATFEQLLLATPEFDLLGQGSIDLNSAYLDGSFSAMMSPGLSAMMREEGSRAASLFWNSAQKRVSIPFTLKGPTEEPSAGVNWQGAAREKIESKASNELRKLLGRSLDKSEPEAAALAIEPAPAEQGEQPEPSALRAEITRVRKGSSLLLPDLIVEGVVEGVNIDRASLTVVDAKGRELKRVDRIAAVTDYLAAAPDPAARATVSWRVGIDGKKVALASSPLTIELVLFDTAGNSTTAGRQVEN